jgi:hypothetical protein
VYERAIGVDVEAAVSSEGDAPTVADHKETVALNGKVKHAVGGLQDALLEQGIDAAHLCAQSDLHGVGAADASFCRATGSTQRLRHHLLKGDPSCLKGSGIDVGDVVANHAHAYLMCLNARDAREHRL